MSNVWNENERFVRVLWQSKTWLLDRQEEKVMERTETGTWVAVNEQGPAYETVLNSLRYDRH